jgi:hypothetical protein
MLSLLLLVQTTAIIETAEEETWGKKCDGCSGCGCYYSVILFIIFDRGTE